MADRASIFQATQLGVETTSGTAVSALKKLTGTSIELAPKAEVQSFKPRGMKYTTITQKGKEWAEGPITGLVNYNELVYWLSSLLKVGVVTTPSGGTASRQWVFEPSSSYADSVKSFTVEMGDNTRAARYAYGLVNALSLKFSRSAVELSGSMISRAIDDNVPMSGNATYTLTAGATPPTAGSFSLTFGGQTASAIAFNPTTATVQTALEGLSTIGAGNVRVWASTSTGAGTLAVAANVYTIEFTGALAAATQTLTGTFTTLTASGSITLAAGVTGAAVTSLDLKPVMPEHVSVYLADTQAGLGSATALNRVSQVEWGLSDRFGMIWPLNASKTSWDGHTETDPKLTCSIDLEADQDGMGLLAYLRNGATKWMRIKCEGEVIEGSIKYSLTIDQPMKIINPKGWTDNDALFGISWEAEGVHDATWGKAMSVTVVNKIASL